jgi:hypothetical protein
MTHPAPTPTLQRAYARRVPTMTVEHESIAAVYDNRASAEVAILALARSKFDMRNLSVIGKDHSTEEVVVGFPNPGDRLDVWARTGAFWGQLTGVLFGSALFVIPRIGTLFAAGPIVGRVIRALEGKGDKDGMGVLGVGLYSIGISKAAIVLFETQLRTGKFIIIAHGSHSDVSLSRTVLVNAEHHSGKAHECCG